MVRLHTVAAIALANSVDRESELHDKREKEYEDCIKRLGGMEVPAEMLGLITMALEENPEQDFLGSMFMRLELGNHWKGQFFTPYSVCKTMAEMNALDLEATIATKGWVSVNDPACGAGAYYDEDKKRYMRYSPCRNFGYAKYLRKVANRKVRRSKDCLKHGSYRKVYDYWWELF